MHMITRRIRYAAAALSLAFAAAAAWADGAAGIHWTVPSTWKAQAQRAMRVATYDVPPAAGDKDAGECAVYSFGSGQGGAIDANIQRWIGQFEATGGKPPAADTKKRTINGFAVTTIDVSGTYLGMGGPMAGSHASQPNYRLLGAIVEAPQGNVFFKFTGPKKTVTAHQAEFDKLLASISR